jgi:hypothetical protein
MCGLCGVFGGEAHWTDAAGNDAVFGSGARVTRRGERRYGVELANEVLRLYGLTVADWDGRSFVLRSATGQARLVDHIAAVWPVAARLAGRPPDPLDPALLDRLEREP